MFCLSYQDKDTRTEIKADVQVWQPGEIVLSQPGSIYSFVENVRELDLHVKVKGPVKI